MEPDRVSIIPFFFCFFWVLIFFGVLNRYMHLFLSQEIGIGANHKPQLRILLLAACLRRLRAYLSRRPRKGSFPPWGRILLMILEPGLVSILLEPGLGSVSGVLEFLHERLRLSG